MPVNITPQLSAAYVIKTWPAVMPVFIRLRLPCVGCDMARFDTLEDIAINYDLDLDDFLRELRAAAEHGRQAAGNG